MSFASMPIYTGDYQRDTRHLTVEEHGCYFLLLMFCWDQKGPVPLDERRICGIVNARSGGEIESLRRVLAEYFVRMEDGYYNSRMMEEVVKFEKISQARRAGGFEKARKMRDRLRSAQAEQEQSLSIAEAVLERVSPSPSPSPTKKQKPLSASRTAFEVFWKAYPHVPNRSSKAESLKRWDSYRLDACAPAVMAALDVAKVSPDWKKDGGAFVQAAEVWLKKRKWENGEIEVSRPVRDWV